MLSVADARDRAIRRAIETGEMAEMDFIHAVQQAEGYQTCFGRTEEACSQMGCRWRDGCIALADTEAFCDEHLLALRLPVRAGA